MKQNQPQRSGSRDQQAREKKHCTAGMRGTCSSQRSLSSEVGIVGVPKTRGPSVNGLNTTIINSIIQIQNYLNKQKSASSQKCNTNRKTNQTQDVTYDIIETSASPPHPTKTTSGSRALRSHAELSRQQR